MDLTVEKERMNWLCVIVIVIATTLMNDALREAFAMLIRQYMICIHALMMDNV
jgi:hypothetical protein